MNAGNSKNTKYIYYKLSTLIKSKTNNQILFARKIGSYTRDYLFNKRIYNPKENEPRNLERGLVTSVNGLHSGELTHYTRSNQILLCPF